MGALRDENQKQNMEIASLKETVQLQNNTIIQHEAAIKELIIADDHKMIENDRRASLAAMSRRERPARLLPSFVLRGKKRNDTDLENRNLFYGPPASCSDLTRLGYTLNGFYTIKRPMTDEKLKYMTKLDVVYCTFRQEGTFDQILVEKPVYPPPFTFSSPVLPSDDDVYFRFTVVRNTKSHSGVLTFDPSELNKGNGFDGKTGVFKPPRFGIYHFSYELTYTAGIGRGNTSIVNFYMNDGIVANPLTSVSIWLGFENKISHQVTLQLKMSDSVCLKATNKNSSNNVATDPDYPFTETVMGYLLKPTLF